MIIINISIVFRPFELTSFFPVQEGFIFVDLLSLCNLYLLRLAFPEWLSGELCCLESYCEFHCGFGSVGLRIFTNLYIHPEAFGTGYIFTFKKINMSHLMVSNSRFSFLNILKYVYEEFSETKQTNLARFSLISKDLLLQLTDYMIFRSWEVYFEFEKKILNILRDIFCIFSDWIRPTLIDLTYSW